MKLKRGETWGWKLLVRLACGHEAEIVPAHVNAQGVYVGRLECPGEAGRALGCGRIYDDVRLEGWGQ